MRRILFSTIKILISAALLYLALRKVNLPDLASRINIASLGWIGMAIAVTFLQIFVGVLRWREISAECGAPLATGQAMRFNLIGTFFNSCLPGATGGEALYADMGHLGRKPIIRAWYFVFCALVINYLGQGAFLLKHPGATVIYDLRASYAVRDTVARYGGKALMNRVGHAFIKRRMREENAIFGGEVTGHYYFRDNYYADNGFIPALLILELMSRKGQTLEDLLAPLRARYFISGEINTKVSSMEAVDAKLDQLAAEYAGGNLYRMDGVSAEFPDWHFNVRPSNTEPLLRLNLEAVTRELMEKKRDEVLALIRG